MRKIKWDEFIFYTIGTFLVFVVVFAVLALIVISYGVVLLPFILGALIYFWVEHGWRPHKVVCNYFIDRFSDPVLNLEDCICSKCHNRKFCECCEKEIERQNKC